MQIKILEDLFDSDGEGLLVPKNSIVDVLDTYTPEEVAAMTGEDSLIIQHQGAYVSVFKDEYEVYVPNYQDSM